MKLSVEYMNLELMVHPLGSNMLRLYSGLRNNFMRIVETSFG